MKIVLLGSGNVATHLGTALKQTGNEILQVWSRNKQHAEQLALKLSAIPLTAIEEIQPDADLYILAVKDDAIASLAKQLVLGDKVIIHTSGTTDLQVLQHVSSNTGVFYPLQTFSKNTPINFKNIPILIEGNSSQVTAILDALAVQLSGNVQELNSEKRRSLHVAAVFACNYTNHLYALAQQILENNNLEFYLLRPLIAETAKKVQHAFPKEVQTGPAIRQDEKIIESHLEYLKENNPQLVDLYRQFSQSIVNFHHKRLRLG